jgi:hypothetical protein
MLARRAIKNGLARVLCTMFERVTSRYFNVKLAKIDAMERFEIIRGTIDYCSQKALISH